ncbi:hypothetical protein CVV68_00030 [Arthrobacter livingstonensis]|uniref:Uncharacterized protein n=1 Tax=Arthrobacter livingstonensis TaxID=670078 RepID=A0A2V5LNT6_9MICC|nr:hypothetical protein [Arthrobacter livingstonensis]PYI69550.1 hypothetical protein CVV68_00030 [Arthrobacter livingstonensis]
MAYAYGSGFKFPIRRGFYDATADQGFGWDKVYWKHNITSIAAIQFAMGGPGAWQGNDWATSAYANKIVCSGSTCKVTESIKVLTVSNKGSYSVYYNQPVGGVLGLKTAYCIGYIKCPSWVTIGLANGGSARAAAPSSMANPGTLPESQPVTTSDQSYLSYQPMKLGSVVDSKSYMKQQQDFKVVNESFASRK